MVLGITTRNEKVVNRTEYSIEMAHSQATVMLVGPVHTYPYSHGQFYVEKRICQTSYK